MSERVTANKLEEKVACINLLGAKIRLDHHAAGYRVFTADDTRDLSPRYQSARECMAFLEGLESGFTLGIINSVRKLEDAPTTGKRNPSSFMLKYDIKVDTKREFAAEVVDAFGRQIYVVRTDKHGDTRCPAGFEGIMEDCYDLPHLLGWLKMHGIVPMSADFEKESYAATKQV